MLTFAFEKKWAGFGRRPGAAVNAMRQHGSWSRLVLDASLFRTLETHSTPTSPKTKKCALGRTRTDIPGGVAA